MRAFDVLAGKHGDHIGGEREAVRALIGGKVDAACIIDGNHLAFEREGMLPPGATRPRPDSRLRPLQLHGARGTPQPPVKRFRELLLGMSYADGACGRCSIWRGSSSGCRAAPPATRS